MSDHALIDAVRAETQAEAEEELGRIDAVAGELADHREGRVKDCASRLLVAVGRHSVTVGDDTRSSMQYGPVRIDVEWTVSYRFEGRRGATGRAPKSVISTDGVASEEDTSP